MSDCACLYYGRGLTETRVHTRACSVHAAPVLAIAGDRDRDYERAAAESYPTVTAAERERHGTVHALWRELYGTLYGSRAKGRPS